MLGLYLLTDSSLKHTAMIYLRKIYKVFKVHISPSAWIEVKYHPNSHLKKVMNFPEPLFILLSYLKFPAPKQNVNVSLFQFCWRWD